VPFVFDEYGGILPHSQTRNWRDEEIYLGQYKYITKHMTAIISTIIENDPENIRASLPLLSLFQKRTVLRDWLRLLPRLFRPQQQAKLPLSHQNPTSDNKPKIHQVLATNSHHQKDYVSGVLG
jgi:hypothetical protein